MIENNRSEASMLDGLPDADRKETEEIISEIEKDEKDLDQAKGKEGDAPIDTAAKPKEGDEPDKPVEVDKKPVEEPARKPVKLMPSYVHEITTKKLNEQIESLKQEITKANAGKDTSSDQPQKPNADQQAQLEKKVNELAEAHGLKPELVKSLVDLGMEFGGKLPAEVEEKLKVVDQWKTAQEIQAEEQAFNSAFDEHVLPLIKAEYGEAVASDTIALIREEMKGKAYSDEFAHTPYSVIYKGVDDFRKHTRPAAKSAEASRGGAHAAGADGGGAGSGEETAFENYTDADIDKMDGPTFDRYSQWLQDRERNRR